MALKTNPELTIGMACRNDFDGVYFTLQSLRLHHDATEDWCELLVLDNEPDRPSGTHVKELCRLAKARYIPYRDTQSTSVRDRLFSLARAPHVLVIDCHVLLARDAIQCLRDYYQANPQSIDLIQGPLYSDSLLEHRLWTHMTTEWNRGIWGTWAHDERGADAQAPAFEIPQQGLGLFSCAKAAWPGFNPLARGFGGEEGYIQEKFRRLGRKTLCLPGLRWVHRFTRKGTHPYSIYWRDIIRNHALGFYELGLDLTIIRDHWAKTKSPDYVDRIIAEACREWDEFTQRVA